MSSEPFRNHLPQWLLSDSVLPLMSLDSYIYYSCGACGMHCGTNPALVLDRESIRRVFSCPGCRSKDHMKLNIYVFASWLRCDDCRHEWGEATTGFFFASVCEACGSTR